jgi:hypothetical protein
MAIMLIISTTGTSTHQAALASRSTSSR